jgi:hypothetical protein
VSEEPTPTTLFKFTLRAMQHSRQIGDSSITLVATVNAFDSATFQNIIWSPWSNPVTLTEAGFPVVGQTLYDIRPGTGQTSHWLYSLSPFADWARYYRVRQIDWSAVPDSKGHSVWEARIQATDHRIYCPEPQIQRQDVMKARVADRYRDDTPNSDTVAEDEAIGDPTEIAGKPEKFSVAQVSFTLTLPWWTDTDGYTDGYPRLDELVGPRLNKVNTNAFLGFPAHSVMLVGVDVQPVRDETLRVSVQFLYDAWYHFDQEPLLDVDQRPRIALDNEDPPVPRCEKVLWKDRSAGVNDFDSLFSEDELDWAQLGWKSWVTACSDAAASFSDGYALTVQESLTADRDEPESEEEEGPEPEPEPPPGEPE